MVKWSNIPVGTRLTHRLYTFLPGDGSAKAYQAAIDYAAGKSDHHFITFVAEPGRGKTHLALGIGWHWLDNDMGLIRYYQVESLLDDMRAGYNVKDDQIQDNFDQLLRHLKTMPLLILDDLGVELSTPWAAAKLDEIIDYRYINENQTVFTTNLEAEKLSGRLGSRISEGNVYTIDGPDYRKVIATARAAGEQKGEESG